MIPKNIADRNKAERAALAASKPQTALETKGRAFAAMLLQLAQGLGVDLTALEDINIGSLLAAAQAVGASQADIANASALLLALARDVEAESGKTWADTWQELKARLPEYIAALMTEEHA